MSELIAGFPRERWDKFRQPIDRALVSKDPNGLDYVKHQVCIEMLNECFGVDGWWQEIVTTWFQPDYSYKTKNGEKPGRAYAEAQVKLYIGAPGAEPICRENIGSQVAGGDWSETRKGAVSEALKRCAALLGWAGNVYKTEAFSAHEERQNGNGGTARRLETPADDIQHAQYHPDGAPANAAAERFDSSLAPEPEAIDSLDKFKSAMLTIGVRTPEQMAEAKRAAGYEADKLAALDVIALQTIYATTLANREAAA